MGLDAERSAAVEAVAAHEDELRDALMTSALFGRADWDEAAIREIAGEFETIVVKGDEVVMRRGEPSDNLLLVVSGRLRVVLELADGGETVLAEHGRGETVGEIGLITGDPRTATVYAARDSILARLPRASFQALCRRHPELMMERFAGGMLRRLVRDAHRERDAPSEFRGSITLVAAEAGIELEGLSEALRPHLATIGATTVLTSSRSRAALGEDSGGDEPLRSEDEAKLVRWLGAQERVHRFVVYCADKTSTPWSAQCIRQADHVVFVARSSAVPSEVFEWAAVGQSHRLTSLVLIHDDGVVRPGAAAAWSAACGTPNVFHVRDRSDADVARLARLLAREGVALVIGGGGARVFAAVGVARVLTESGCPIDTVCGVSAGAMLGGLLAMGLSVDELLSRCAAAARRVDYTIPIYALTTGKNWSATLEELFGETQIEDLLLPFCCTSVNLSAAELLVHDRGSLLHAVRASTAIPGIIPPVWHEGDLLVDGGLMNNLPIEIAHSRLGVGRMLAVSVSPERQRAVREPFGYHVSGWRGVGVQLLRRTRRGMPTAMDLLTQAMLVADTKSKRSATQLADFIFTPPAGGYSLMDWQHFAAIAQSGYRYATELMLDEDVRQAILGAHA
jgi:predicted acylesterase/phospholipase RssA/CRP-like cAMP-binding protein